LIISGRNDGLGELIKAYGNKKTDTNFPRTNSAEDKRERRMTIDY